MNATSLLLGLVIISTVCSVQGASERIIFTQLRKGLHLVPVVLNKRFTIDCSVNNNHVKISLYRKLSNGQKEIVKVDGEVVKRKKDVFGLVIRSYFESTDFYCHGELYGTAYEKEVKVVIIATTQELSPTPEIFPGLSKVRVGDTVKIECRCRGQLSVIKWFKDGESVVAKSEKIKIRNYFNIRTRESISMLSVKNIDQSDAGVYRCQASSKLHPGYSSFIDSKVEIKGNERIYWLVHSEKNSTFVQSGASVVLDCSLSNSEAPVTFYRLGRLGTLFRILPLRGKFEQIGEQKLFVRNTSINDMGFYICKSHGVTNKKISLFVAPEAKNMCSIFKPKGMQILCENSKDEFKEYIKRLWK